MSGLITHWVLYPREGTGRYTSYSRLDGPQSGLDVLEKRKIYRAAIGNSITFLLSYTPG
jgi:hypothetical protein